MERYKRHYRYTVGIINPGIFEVTDHVYDRYIDAFIAAIRMRHAGMCINFIICKI